MMSRYFAASIAATVLAMTCASAKDYSLTFHFTPPMYWCGDSLEKDAVYSSCDILNPNALDLGGFAPNQAWVIITGVAAETERGARSVRFGLEHGMSHSLIWATCTGGGDVEQDDLAGTWPASGTWIETYWDGCYAVTENEIGATRVGFLTVNPGSVGFMRIKGDPTRGGDLIVTTCDGVTTNVCVDRRGVGHADDPGGSQGFNGCSGECAVPVHESTWSAVKASYR